MSVSQSKPKKLSRKQDKMVINLGETIRRFFTKLLQKNWLKGLIIFLTVSAIYYLQHRFWLFPAVYSDMNGQMGNEGDSYYNLSLFMQNMVNLTNGRFYSLEGDHFSFYSNIIGTTAHNYAASLVFGLLYAVLQQPILSFNLIYFGNLFLIQLGIFFLVRYYTKNSYLAFFAGFLFPLSGAVKTFYVGHIHASYYWALPFWTLAMEKFLTLKFNFKNWKHLLLVLSIFITTIWLVMAEWHVFVFSFFWMAFWFCSKLLQVWQQRKSLLPQISITLGVILISVVILLPLSLAYLNTSKIYNSVRTVNDVLSTNFSTENFYGSKSLLIPALDTANSFTQNESISNKLAVTSKNVNLSSSTYPDFLYNFSFWLGLLIYLPWLGLIIFSRRKNFSNGFLYLNIFLFASVIALGPFPNIANSRVEMLPLPHFFLYQIFPPLAAIRAIWRINILGDMALLVLWSMILQQAWCLVKSVLESSNNLQPKLKLRLILKYSVVGYATALLLFLAFLVNAGWRADTAFAARQFDEFLYSSLSQLSGDGSKTLYFIDRDQDKNFQVSYHNLKQGYFQLRTVAGGIAGVYPSDLSILNSLFLNLNNYDLGLQALAAKKVDFIVENKNFELDNAKQNSLEMALEEYYDLVSENQTYRIWQWNKTSDHMSDWRDLKYFLTASKYQPLGEEWSLRLNFENTSNLIYANPEIVKTTKFQIQIWQNGEKVDQKTVELGEKALIFPHTGYGYNFKLKPNLRNEGTFELKLFKNGHQVYSQEILPLSANDYHKKIADLKVENLQLEEVTTVATSTYLNYVATGDWVSIPVLPVKSTLTIKTGVLDNSSPRQFLNNNYKVSIWYYNTEGQRYTLPGWAFQPDCNLNGNYFSGDRTDFWCDQHLPMEPGFVNAKVTLNQDR